MNSFVHKRQQRYTEHPSSTRYELLVRGTEGKNVLCSGEKPGDKVQPTSSQMERPSAQGSRAPTLHRGGCQLPVSQGFCFYQDRKQRSAVKQQLAQPSPYCHNAALGSLAIIPWVWPIMPPLVYGQGFTPLAPLPSDPFSAWPSSSSSFLLHLNILSLQWPSFCLILTFLA